MSCKRDKADSGKRGIASEMAILVVKELVVCFDAQTRIRYKKPS